MSEIKKSSLFNQIVFSEAAYKSRYGKYNKAIGRNFLNEQEDKMPSDWNIHELLRTGEATNEQLSNIDYLAMYKKKGVYELRAINARNHDLCLSKGIPEQEGLAFIAKYEAVCLRDIDNARQNLKSNKNDNPKKPSM